MAFSTPKFSIVAEISEKWPTGITPRSEGWAISQEWDVSRGISVPQQKLVILWLLLWIIIKSVIFTHSCKWFLVSVRQIQAAIAAAWHYDGDRKEHQSLPSCKWEPFLNSGSPMVLITSIVAATWFVVAHIVADTSSVEDIVDLTNCISIDTASFNLSKTVMQCRTAESRRLAVREASGSPT